jgi:hypothetical protein
MRSALVALVLLTAPLAAAGQPALVARAGFGLDVGGKYGKVGGSGTLGLAAGGWAAGLHADYSEKIFAPTARTVGVSLLAGKEIAALEDRVVAVAWAGPAVVRAVTPGERLRTPNCGLFCAEYGESNEHTVLGATVRVGVSAFPARHLPVGLSVDAGLTLTQPVAAVSGTVGLAVRLGG